MSDTHSHFEPHRRLIPASDGGEQYGVAMVGGYQLIASAIHEAREDAKRDGLNFVAVHCGDSFQGSVYFQRYRGIANALALNAMNLDIMAVGNHEFDLGPEPFAAFCDKADFPVISSNLVMDESACPSLRYQEKSGRLITSASVLPVMIKTMLDGTAVGFLGLTLESLPNLADTGPGLWLHAPVEFACHVVKHLRRQGLKHIIVLSHLGYEQDVRLAESVDGISAILGGHTHDLQGQQDSLNLGKRGVCGERISGAPIFHCGENAQHLGLYDLILDGEGTVLEIEGETIVPIDKASVTPEAESLLRVRSDIVLTVPDPTIYHSMFQHHPLTQQKYSQPLVVGKALEHVRVPTEKVSSDLAPMVAEAIFQNSEVVGLQPDLALLNAGVIRTGIQAGRYDDLVSLFHQVIPFDLDLIVLHVSASTLHQVIQRASKEAQNPEKNGRFPYLHSPKCRYPHIQSNKIYRIVTTRYVADGKDGYLEFKSCKRECQPLQLKLRDACELYFEKYFRETVQQEAVRSVSGI